MWFRIILNMIWNMSVWPIDGTLIITTTPGQSGPGSSGKEGWVYASKSSRTEASPLDTQDTS